MTAARFILLSLTVAAIAGCATKRPAPPTPPAPPVIVTPAPSAVMGPKTYVTVASSIDRFMLGASAMAATRARSPALRAAAGQIATDHRGISAQLSFAGRRLNLLPDGRLLAADAAHLGELERSADFDSVYRWLVSANLDRAAKLHGDFAERGSSPTLRPVARYASGLVEKNLSALRALPPL